MWKRFYNEQYSINPYEKYPFWSQRIYLWQVRFKIQFHDNFIWSQKVEIVMNEMRKLKMSADFFLQIHPMIFLGVQECKVLLYIGGM